jgi:hypothetical protein
MKSMDKAMSAARSAMNHAIACHVAGEPIDYALGKHIVACVMAEARLDGAKIMQEAAWDCAAKYDAPFSIDAIRKLNAANVLAAHNTKTGEK